MLGCSSPSFRWGISYYIVGRMTTLDVDAYSGFPQLPLIVHRCL